MFNEQLEINGDNWDEYSAELEYSQAAEKLDDRWVAGGGGKETPFTYNNKRWLYVYNHKTREHGFLDMDSDIVYNSYE